MSGVRIAWARGGEATIVALTAESVTLVSTVAAPPGSRLDGSLGEGSPAFLRFKIHSSTKNADGDYLLVGRPLDLTRELRERVAALLK